MTSESALPVRWGIIGPGDIAHRIMAPAMHRSPHADLVAVARRDRAKAQAFAAEHGAGRAYGSVAELVADPDVDAVYIATPVDRHLADTIACADAGKHVLCEKPLALDVAEGEQMRDAVRRSGITFMTCFYQRFNARHRKLKELLEAGAVGQVTSVRMNFSGRYADRPGAWRHDPSKSGGGCYMDNGSHCVDMLRFLFGEVTDAIALVDTLAAKYPVEDTASSVLRLANGAHAVVTSYWSSGDPDENRNSMLEVHGTDGIIQATPLHDKFSRGLLRVTTERGVDEFSYDASTHEAVLAEFAAALAERRPPAITVDDGIAALRVVAAVYESGRSGRLVTIPTGGG